MNLRVESHVAAAPGVTRLMHRRRKSTVLFVAFFSVVCFTPFAEAFAPHPTGRGCPSSLSLSSSSPSDAVVSNSNSVLGSDIDRLTSAGRAAAAALTLGLLVVASPAGAVSGGGSDFASLDISGQDFSNKNYKGKDFTQVVAKRTNFAKSNLQGCRFYNSFLVEADFEGADARGASFERNNMDGVNLKNAVLGGAYFGDSLSGVLSIENADFTDASIPPKLLNLVCGREDAKGVNPTTGENTRDTLMCPP